MIQPNFGLLDILVSLKVLTDRQLHDVVGVEKSEDKMNECILKFLTTENQCRQFLKALKMTKQLHVVNFINERGMLMMFRYIYHSTDKQLQ